MNISTNQSSQKGAFKTIALLVFFMCNQEFTFSAPFAVSVKGVAIHDVTDIQNQLVEKAYFKRLVRTQRYGSGATGKLKLKALHDELCMLAKANDFEAQFVLGKMYEDGRGILKNYEAAEQLYRLSAFNNYQPAIDLLTQYHFNLNQAVNKHKLPVCFHPPVPVPTPEPINLDLNQPSEKVLRMAKTQPATYKLILQLSGNYDLDPMLVLSFISTESAFNTKAVSHKNAQGLMQLIPETAARFGVKNPFSAKENIRGGMAYLEWLLAYYQGNLTLAAAGYNAGEGAVDKYKGIPPYKETQAYVKKILSLYNKKTHDYRKDYIEPSAICKKGC